MQFPGQRTCDEPRPDCSLAPAAGPGAEEPERPRRRGTSPLRERLLRRAGRRTNRPGRLPLQTSVAVLPSSGLRCTRHSFARYERQKTARDTSGNAFARRRQAPVVERHRQPLYASEKDARSTEMGLAIGSKDAKHCSQIGMRLAVSKVAVQIRQGAGNRTAASVSIAEWNITRFGVIQRREQHYAKRSPQG
jgi:hypothetical protein